jgi:hypothetical protein
MFDSKQDSTLGFRNTLSKAVIGTDDAAHIDQQALNRASEIDSKNHSRRKEKTAKRFDGAVVEVRTGLFLYKINGDHFDRKEIARLQALISVTKHDVPFLDEMLAAYHPERNNDDNHWHDMRGLQGWLSGRRYTRQIRRSGFRNLAKPASAYCARLAIAAKRDLLQPLEIVVIGGGKRRREGLTCKCCKKRLAALCRQCAKTNSTPRKPVQAEIAPVQQIEVQG